MAEDQTAAERTKAPGSFGKGQKAVAFVGQLVREGEDPAVISKYVDKTNEKFAAQGIMEIDKPAVAEEQGDE